MNKIVKSELGNQEVFSRNLRKYLAITGKTQRDVSVVVGVSSGTVNDWARGRAYPRMDKIQKLADFFGISKSELVEEWVIEEDPIPQEDKEVLDLFHKVPEEKRELVLSMIRAAVDNL